MSDVVYRGYGGYHGTRVTVQRDGHERPLRHYVRHSPTGFAWGYGGSGPAELARCILIDYLMPQGRVEAVGGELLLPVSYQDFKFQVVASWPWDDMPAAAQQGTDPAWTLTGEELESWLSQQRAE